MIPASASGFVLATLSVLASGYLIYDVPLLRWWLPKSTGYVLYFRILTTGLLLTFFLAALLYPAMLHNVSVLGLQLNPEFSPVMAFPVAVCIWGLATLGASIGRKYKPKWGKELDLKTLNGKELDQFIYEKISNGQMIMVTLENQKVYTGWPLEAPNNEENKWLRLLPQWSGYRDEKSTITVQVDYSKVIGNLPPDEQNRMLIPVGKITTVQPFDVEIFQKFNPEIFQKFNPQLDRTQSK